MADSPYSAVVDVLTASAADLAVGAAAHVHLGEDEPCAAVVQSVTTMLRAPVATALRVIADDGLTALEQIARKTGGVLTPQQAADWLATVAAAAEQETTHA